MAVAKAVGYPDYEATGANKNIAWLFAKKAIKKLYDNSILSSITNTDADTTGITGTGSKVIFNTIPTVTVKDRVKGGTTIWETLESPSVELDINKAKEFAFRMDKIDIKQFTLDMMSELAKDAGKQMDLAICKDLLNSVYADAAAQNKGLTAGKAGDLNLGATNTPLTVTKVNILDTLIDMIQVGEEQNWDDDDGWWVALPPTLCSLIKKSDLKDASLTGDDKSLLRNRGNIGKFDKWNIFKTNQYTTVTDGGTCYNILFGHKMGVCFASQLTETEYFEKFETTWGKGMKGLNVYGYKTIKPEALGVLYCKKG